MSILAKLGIYYIENSKKDLFIEVLSGYLAYIGISKLQYFALPYLALMFVSNYLIDKKGTNLKSIALLNGIVSTCLMVFFYFYFDNHLKNILNPIISSVLAAIVIYFASFRFKVDESHTLTA